MSLTDYVASLRQKPEQVRQRIALVAAAGVTGIVVVGWLGTLVATGAFALGPSTKEAPSAFAQVTPTAATASETKTNFNELVGAVGAGLGTSKPELLIEDNGDTSTLDRTAPPAEATVLTF